MLYQPWIQNPAWERTDPKLKQLGDMPFVLGHTQSLVDSISVQPAGVLMVRGPRQAGKSTFLRQFIQKALRDGVPPHRIGLLEAEALESRHDLLSEIRDFCGSGDGDSVLLIDEITAIDKWWMAIKLAADQGAIANALIVSTGSSAMDLSEGADLLPGRRGKRFPVDYELLPVRYRDVADHLTLEEFLLTGGFPWAVTEYARHQSIPPYVFELYAAWIQGCLVKRNHSIQNLPALLRYLVNRTGTGISVSGLARDSGFGSNHTAETYLTVLERNYIILTSSWSEPGSMVLAPRKNRKFFPSDPFLFHLFGSIGQNPDFWFFEAQETIRDPQKMGLLVECLVASELRHSTSMYPLRYFLGKREIDFVGKTALEVKFQNQVDLREFSWVKKVLPREMQFTVLTKTTRSHDENLRAVPLAEWLLEPKE